MASKWVRSERITTWEIGILLALLGIIVAVVGILVSVLLKNREFRDIATEQAEHAAAEITDSLSKQTEQTTSKIKECLREQTEQTISEIKGSLRNQTKQINAQILMLFPQLPVAEWHEGEVHPFDGGSSNIRVVAIDPARGEVELHWNIRGSSINEVLRTSEIRTIPVPGGGTYRFMLKDVTIRDGRKTAEFIVTEAKE